MMRQKDHILGKLVHELEVGAPSEALEYLIRTLERPLNLPPQVRPSVLLGTNFAVDMYNQERIHDQPGQMVYYRAIDEGNRPVFLQCPAPKVLTLKVGAPVILLRNISKQFVNGLQGIVHETGETPVVNFDGYLVEMQRYSFNYEGSSCRRQFPLKLAYALTVHRAQGQTLQHVIVDCKDFFAAGQLAVAIGRARCLSNLQVLHYSNEVGSLPHSEVLLDFLRNAEHLDISSGSLSEPDVCCKQDSTVCWHDLVQYFH